MRFLAPSRAFHLTGWILLMRNWAIVGTAITRAVRARGYDFPAVKFSGPRGGGDRWSPMVLGSQKGSIVSRLMLMPHLRTCGFKVAFPSPSLLFMSRTSTDSAVASVIADAIHPDVIDHSSVVDMHVGDPDVIDAAVVVEVPTSPVSARIAGANIAETIVNAAVETDMRSPITRIPDISALMPAPIARGPEQADRWRSRPGTGHPVVTVRAVGPVAGRPDITVAGTRWLLVNRQHRWGDRDRH